MTTHISARIAWHDSGWNGHICRNPKGNTYCIGQHSYPGEMIASRRDTDWEQQHAGQPIKGLKQLPPCVYSANAFGTDLITSFAPPPSWFRDGTQIAEWPLPPATVSLWPYEEMYNDEVLSLSGKPKYDAEKRRLRAEQFFAEIAPHQSLIFYYSNYSNPFSEGDSSHYVVVGVSRVKVVGGELHWKDQSTDMAQRYGRFVWDRNITSHYPDQGFRIPYHLYMDRPDVLDRILLVPENARNFKYATRHITDDDALILIEQLSEVVKALQEIGDTSENWDARQSWLASITAELWQNRGLYPGLASVFDFLGFSEAISYTKQRLTTQGDEQSTKDELFALLDGARDQVAGLTIIPQNLKAVRRTWKLLDTDQRNILRDTLPRFELTSNQIATIVQEPMNASVTATHAAIAENPYVLSEQYVGTEPDDMISFNKIDHGLLPSPDLGEGPGVSADDWRRLRALCVEQLKSASQHTFLPASQVLEGLNYRLSVMPEWKRHQFTERYLRVDEEDLSGAVTFREVDGQLYLYRKEVFEDEREVEATLRRLTAQPNILARFAVTAGHWRNSLYEATSVLAQRHPRDYDDAVDKQVAVCQGIFPRSISVISGAAGTGKTTIVKAIIDAIERGHGTGTSFLLLAPTGKAADRLRERTKKEATTIHSFLARLGWLNENFTYKRAGGKREQSVTTFIIDESSMLDLPLLATFFRAVNWNAVQRLIFVGDPSQLPPIGIGRVFADLIDWLQDEGLDDSMATLETNMRQIENRLTNQGTGILDLANLFIRRRLADQKSADLDAQEDRMLELLQQSGAVDQDLRILYWQNSEDLERQLLETIVADLEHDTGETFDLAKPYALWEALMQPRDAPCKPEAMQVISPYRGDLFGVENLNIVLQKHKNRSLLEKKGQIGGITLRDKVIQVINRPASNQIWAYNTQTRKSQKVQVFNGEIGFTKPHGYDHDKWNWTNFRLERFQVIFSQKQHLWVEYGSDQEVENNLELAYAISVHKSQGSEFSRVYFVLPKHKRGLLSRELFYTGMTRASKHCTLLIEEDIGPILALRRPESSQLDRINSSLFAFRPAPAEYQRMWEWYEEGKIHRTLTGHMVRSKSEVIIANLLHDKDIPFEYEVPLRALDGTFYLPDFTLKLRGETWYWEHWGMLFNQSYRAHRDKKLDWYRQHGFADRLIETEERSGFDSQEVLRILSERLSVD